MSGRHVLVVARSPVPGRAKTRLGAVVGDDAAALLAHAALLDTLAACAVAFPAGRRHLALAGTLEESVRPGELAGALDGWCVRPQATGRFGERLAAAHAALDRSGPDRPDAVVQLGMDTPQVTPAGLAAVLGGLDGHDALVGPAEDGGWWVLALRRPGDATVLRGVAMSTDHTGRDTREALVARGLLVATGPVLRDVDTVEDAGIVAALAPSTRFARAWARLGGGVAP